MVPTFSTFFDLILLFCLLTVSDGNLWGWGGNAYGELGLGHNNPVSSPTKMSLTSVKQLQVGAYHVIAVCSNIFGHCKTHKTDDASVWTWGRSVYGQLGTGNSSSKDTSSSEYCYSPVEVPSVPFSVDSVAAFGENSFLISSNYHTPSATLIPYLMLFVC
jgi:alpha-tubulin suppressor-like RCC1 family protein